MTVAEGGPADRRGELAARLAAVRGRIDAAARAAGRDPAGVTLIAITKTYPPADVRLLADLGIADVGENRDQEAAPKAAQCADLGLTWHFVGQLQTNKARSVVRYAAVVHSVDRPHLVQALSAAAARAEREIACLVQVSLDREPGRGGAAPSMVASLAEAIEAAPALRLAGLMAVAPQGVDPVAAFTELAGIAAALRADHPRARMLSAGMSDDLEAAIACGATHVRVGTALLGRRRSLVG